LFCESEEERIAKMEAQIEELMNRPVAVARSEKSDKGDKGASMDWDELYEVFARKDEPDLTITRITELE
jgi:hypothetical protein